MRRVLLLSTLILACLSFCAGAEAATVVSDFATLRDAVKNPASLDIELGADITLTAAIPVSLDAKIQGNGKKLTAGGARHFEVQSTAGGGPTFTGVTFDGASTGGGVSVLSGGKATFEGGAFENNRSAATGGAVSVASGGEVTFNGTAFTGNQATSNGGAVSVTGTGKATFSGTIAFSKNTATGNGGAVHLEGAAAEFPSSVSFENNTAANGGAVALSDAVNSKATFNGNTLSPNTATANGGSLYIPGNATVVFNASQSFTGNKAANGGAVWANTLPSSSQTVTFTSNTASSAGGAVYVGGAGTLSDAFKFTTNSAPKGGAVYAGANLTVSGGSFSENTASESGGAIYAAGTATVTGGDFTAKNTATGTGSDMGGGAIWANEIMVEPSGSDPVTFAGQSAQKDGGALFSKGSLKATNAIFRKNTAEGSGGAVMAQGTVALTRTSFSENNSKQKGGAVYAGDTATITSSVFDGNTAKGDGGAVTLDKSTADFEMTATAMLGNSAGDFSSSGRGGALYLNLKAANIDRSTFSGNSSQSASDGQGGAVRLQASAQSTLTNCTLTGNTVTGNTTSRGGAFWLGGPFVMTNCTLSLENETKGTGEKRGGAVYLDAAGSRLSMAATLAVGNKAELGADVFNGGGTLTTGGYNRIAKFGTGTGDTSWSNPNVNGVTETDRQQDTWTSATFFGSNKLADNSGPAIGPSSASRTLQTLALNEAGALAAADRAMDKILASLPGFPAVDQRGVARPQPTGGRKDIGAFEVEQSGGGGEDDPVLTIQSIRISGIPNTLSSVGQTATLTAVVTYRNGTTSTTEKVTWSSSNPSVARIDKDGNIYSRSTGTTAITVTTVRPSATGKPATDSATLEVREEMSYTNVHPDIWILLGEFNETLSAQGAGLTFADSDPAKVKASTFRNTFREAWGLSSEQVTELKSGAPIRFKTGRLPSAQGWSASKPAIDISLGGRRKGDLLPLKYRWSLSWEELSTLMGRKVTQVKNAQELSSVLKLAFVPVNGVAYDVVGGEGVSAADAESKGALKVTNGNNGLTLELTAFVADAASSAKGKPQLIDGLLVIPDGAADGTISGALGLLQRPAAGGGSGSKGEGGGGCDAGVSGMMLALVVAFLLRRKA